MLAMSRTYIDALAVCVASLCLLVSACDAPKSNVVRFGIASAPVTFDPRMATDATSERINRLLYERLVDFDARQNPVPALAHWKALSPTQFRFFLDRKPHRFHTGAVVRAEDVKATYDFILAPANHSPHFSVLSVIKRIEVLDDHRLDFFLHRADALFPAYLVIGIVPKALIDTGHPFNNRPIGSGPFTFVKWDDASRVRIQRVQDGRQFEFVHTPDPTVRVLKLLRGELDMLQNDLSPELIRYLHRQPGISLKQARGSNFTYLGFNLQDPVVGKENIRRAIAYALDRKAIVRHLFGGSARLANALLPPEHWAGNPDLPAYPYDIDASKRLLRQSGYDKNHPVTIVYKTSTDPFRVRLATVIQHQLAQVGIKVDLRTYDWGTFYGDIKAGNFQMYTLSWIGIKTPDIFRYIFHSESMPPQGANRGRFFSPSVDQLIDRAQSESDRERQAEWFRLIQKNLHNALPYVPLWYENHIFAAKDCVSGYRLNMYGNYDGLNSLKTTC
jgi:peptide/nickel transport system substrate-binding protein